jgi:hypothetical protein
MYRYLAQRHEAVDRLVALLAQMEGDLVNLPLNGKTSVTIETAHGNIQGLAEIVPQLAAKRLGSVEGSPQCCDYWLSDRREGGWSGGPGVEWAQGSGTGVDGRTLGRIGPSFGEEVIGAGLPVNMYTQLLPRR